MDGGGGGEGESMRLSLIFSFLCISHFTSVLTPQLIINGSSKERV